MSSPKEFSLTMGGMNMAAVHSTQKPDAAKVFAAIAMIISRRGGGQKVTLKGVRKATGNERKAS